MYEGPAWSGIEWLRRAAHDPHYDGASRRGLHYRDAREGCLGIEIRRVCTLDVCISPMRLIEWGSPADRMR
ncbi:MAG TPA: hypothetical protein DDW89_09260 [Gammaproteobacteria bacterium]|jgi:hypothetical protein|nr:hypothetical protein [Gammaproteobacteria bacterium]